MVLEQLRVKKKLLGKVSSTKIGYYGLVVRKYSSLEKEVIQVVRRAVEVTVDNEDDRQMTSVNGLQYDYQRRGKSGKRRVELHG